MNALVIRRPSWLHTLSLAQILLFIIYLVFNILNIGENKGVGTPLLLGFILIYFFVFLIKANSQAVTIRLHTFFIFLFILWLSLRVVIDLNDISYLKQVTIGTTSGILLFFFVGTFAKQALDIVGRAKVSLFGTKLILIVFIAISFWIFSSFQERLLDRADIFYIEDVDGGYQRPGNFLIIIFIIVSFSYLSISSHANMNSRRSFVFWSSIYSMGLIVLLVSSQMIGANTATVNVAAIYLITVVISSFSFNERFRVSYLNNEINSFFSKKILFNIIKYSVFLLIILIFTSVIMIQVTGFDLDKTRIFGYGTGENTSITSRVDIFKQTGIDQLSYAPVFGDMNVAKIITGDSGKFLHSFIPNILAELGLLGLIIGLFPFFLVFHILIKNINNPIRNKFEFQHFSSNIWFFFTLFFLLFYANVAVDKSWVVIWFYLGFAVNVIYTNVKSKGS